MRLAVGQRERMNACFFGRPSLFSFSLEPCQSVCGDKMIGRCALGALVTQGHHPRGNSNKLTHRLRRKLPGEGIISGVRRCAR